MLLATQGKFSNADGSSISTSVEFTSSKVQFYRDNILPGQPGHGFGTELNAEIYQKEHDMN